MKSKHFERIDLVVTLEFGAVIPENDGLNFINQVKHSSFQSMECV